MNKYLKAALFVLSEAAALFIAFCVLVVTSFTGGNVKDIHYYMIVLYSSSALLLVLVPLSFYAKKRKWILSGWCLWLILLIVPTGVYEGIRSYRESLTINESQRVDLSRYQPFTGTGHLVVPDSPPTLSLTDSLPLLDGATAFYPLYAAFVQAVYPQAVYDIDTSIVQCNRTNSAYMHLFYRNTDIIFAFGPAGSRYLSFEYAVEFAPEADMLHSDSVRIEQVVEPVPEPSDSTMMYEDEDEIEVNDFMHLTLTAIGREAFVFFVNSKNPLDNLTTEQLRKIYSGEITNWKEAGGNNEKIVAFQRDGGSGSQTAFLQFMGDTPPMIPPQDRIVDFMEGIITQTSDYANYSNAIGYSFNHFARQMVGNKQIKILRIDGVFPSAETVCNHTYPLIFDFYAITRTGESSHNTKRLINWILSPQGQQIVEKTGYCPIR